MSVCIVDCVVAVVVVVVVAAVVELDAKESYWKYH
jgi:hypothetical protein